MIAWNSHLALNAAKTCQCDVTIIILTNVSNEDIQGILLLLMENYDSVIVQGFLSQVAGRNRRRSVGMNVV